VVNLERALALGDRLGGHLVSGHVDCLATVADVKPAGESRVYTLTFPAEHGPFVIWKGSVTLDGISLT
jgi:Riboflavin synthase alpha chain